MKSKHDFLEKVGRGVRRYMQKEWLPKSGYGFDKHLGGFCAHASVILFQRLKKLGYNPRIVEGIGHWFVLCDGYLVDVTASQFGQPEVCVQRYSKIKRIIKSKERDLSFWEQRSIRKHIGGMLKDVAKEVNYNMRRR